jgi:hypothetical protein
MLLLYNLEFLSVSYILSFRINVYDDGTFFRDGRSKYVSPMFSDKVIHALACLCLGSVVI